MEQEQQQEDDQDASGSQPVQIDAKTYRAIECATMLARPQLWPAAVLGSARTDIRVICRSEATLEELSERFGEHVVAAVSQRVLGARVREIQEVMERMGEDSLCHLCGEGRRHAYYEFGLAKVLEENTDWSGTAASLAANLLTVPLGFAVAAGPRSSKSAQIARCRLVMCASCIKARTGFFGGLKIGAAQCAKHPSWARLVREGYNQFLDSNALEQYQ